MSYEVRTTEKFDKDLKKHKGNEKQLEAIKVKLSQYPDKYGKPLSGRLHGIWQERTGPFRVWYVIQEDDKRVILIAFMHKKEAKEMY